MPHSSQPRIKKGSGPSAKLRDHNVRELAWGDLLKDFESRCAYSMRHVQLAGGERHMEIDHFNPRLKDPARNRYRNLMLATRLCNLMKRDKWPKKWQSQKGLRFLNPCREQDYGKHILEDPVSH